MNSRLHVPPQLPRPRSFTAASIAADRKLTGKVCRALAMIIFISIGIWPAFAQQPSTKKPDDVSSSIHGTVSTLQDNAKTGVAGISVKLSGDPLHGTPITADTDEHGAFDFKNLAPGTYTLSIDLQGFKSIGKTIVLAPKQQDTEDLTLELNVVAEKVEVKEATRSFPRRVPRRPLQRPPNPN